jgi:hypothetical protein
MLRGQPEMSSKRLFSLQFRQVPGFCAVLALLMLAPLRALAWSPEGHEIVALVAMQELTPAARSQIARLLGSPAMMVHDASWADEIRDRRPDTAPWHYVDIPLGASGYDAARDCPRRACVVAQIEDDVRILANHGRDDGARAEALRFLIHFTADLHQPLHAEDNNDKGGNDVRVALGRRRSSLHRVWDGDVVEALGFDGGRVADALERSITPAQRKAWAFGTPAQWANEAHAIARDHIYPPLGGRTQLRLSPDYPQREIAIARTQLAKAGVRLAWLLNGVFR